MSEQKKIYAVISYPFLPATTGGEISTLQILTFLGRKTQLRVFTVDPWKPVNKSDFSFELDFAMRFKPTRYANIFLLAKVISEIKKLGADAVFFDQPFMGWMIPFIRLFTGKPVFLRSNNIEYMRFRSMGKSWWSLLYMYEKLVYKSSSLVIFVSDVDQQRAIHEFDLPVAKTLLTPYGIPQQALPEPVAGAAEIIRKRHGIGSNQKILLFFATLNYAPNYEAVEYIALNIVPLLKQQLGDDFCVLVCGKHLPQAIQDQIKALPQIQYLGFVEDIETYIDGADVMINPILSGGGIKTKAVDTLGRGQTVISTHTGAEGLDPAVCGQNLYISADHDWQAFVNNILTHFKQPASTLPPAFFGKYSWEGIIDSILKKLDNLK